MASCLPNRMTLPLTSAEHCSAAIATQTAMAIQAVAQEQIKEKMKHSESPEKRMLMVAEEQQRIMQHTLQQNLLSMATQLPLHIKLSNRGET